MKGDADIQDHRPFASWRGLAAWATEPSQVNILHLFVLVNWTCPAIFSHSASESFLSNSEVPIRNNHLLIFQDLIVSQLACTYDPQL